MNSKLKQKSLNRVITVIFGTFLAMLELLWCTDFV